MTDATKPTICLAMIAKNEEKTIGRCIESAVGIVDSVCVVDTGSTDHTIREARTVCRRNDLPLTLVSSDWVDFATNRNELLQLARPMADFLLTLDCDMTIEKVSEMPDISGWDAGMIAYTGGATWRARFLLNTKHDWHYIGAVHEYSTHDGSENDTLGLLDALVLTHHSDGGGHDQSWQTKAIKYLGLLLHEYIKEPEDPRTLFYLANTLNELGIGGAAVDIWRHRSEMEGTFEEERWVSQYRAAEASNDPHELLACWNARPIRAEPLYHLAKLYRLEGNYHAAELFAREAHLLPYPPSEMMFVDKWIYDWGADFEWAIALWWTGQKEVAQQLNDLILARDDVPEEFRRAAQSNRDLDRVAKVVAVVPVKDNLKYTRGIVEQLEAAEVPTLIMDNGSTGETMQFLMGAEGDNRIAVTQQNDKTIHEMWNRGIEWALEDPEATAVAILNNDLALGPEALQWCADALTGDLVLTCPNYDGRKLDGIQYTQEICAGRYDGTGGIAGFAMVLSLDWVRKHNYRFPDDLTWWYGDNDLLMSVIDSGCQAGIVGGATCVHLDGGSKTGNWENPALNPVLAADREAFLRKWA